MEGKKKKKPTDENLGHLGDDIWEIEKIVEKKYFPKENKVKYLSKWKGWSSNFNTWEPIENLSNVLDLIAQFESENYTN